MLKCSTPTSSPLPPKGPGDAATPRRYRSLSLQRLDDRRCSCRVSLSLACAPEARARADREGGPRCTEHVCEPRVCCEHVIVSRARPRSTRGSPFTTGEVREPSKLEPLGIIHNSQATVEKEIGKHGFVRAVVESKGTMRPNLTSINDVEELVALKLHESSNDRTLQTQDESEKIHGATFAKAPMKQILLRHRCKSNEQDDKCEVTPTVVKCSSSEVAKRQLVKHRSRQPSNSRGRKSANGTTEAESCE